MPPEPVITSRPERAPRRAACILGAALAAVLAGASGAPARAQPVTPLTGEASTRPSLVVNVGQAETVTLRSPAAKVFVAGPDIADVDGTDPTKLIVFGRKPGRTTLYVTTRDGVSVPYIVDVGRPMPGLREVIAKLAPEADLRIVQAPRGVSIIGTVTTPFQAASIKAVAEQFLAADETLNFGVTVTQGTQVNLQVRIAEVSREVSSAIGVNWGGSNVTGRYQVGLMTGRDAVIQTTRGVLTGQGQTQVPDLALNRANGGQSSIGAIYRPTAGGQQNIGLLIDALRARGLITVLAEPNLTATSGQRANFRAGGELPILVAQGGGNGSQPTTTVEFKPFGVGLEFIPTVLDERRISVKVGSEVSELSELGAVTMNGTRVPALSVRRVDTTVELGSGESFAIAGLFKNNTALNTSGLPGLGSLPVLGALFRSQAFQKNQSELVVIVTPYIVRPVTDPAALRLPTDDAQPASELEQLFLGRVSHPPAGKDGAALRLRGPSGFMLQDNP